MANPAFDGKTTSWRRFGREFFMAMRHLRLNSVFAGSKEEIPVTNRTVERNRLHAH